MRRDDFRSLTRTRLRDARRLLDGGQASAAYFLAGFAVECAFKAAIAKSTNRFDFPEKQKVLDSHTHDLTKPLKIAGLQAELDRTIRASPAFARNWSIVKDWKSGSRYDLATTVARARDFYRAVTRRNTGVLTWLRLHW